MALDINPIRHSRLYIYLMKSRMQVGYINFVIVAGCVFIYIYVYVLVAVVLVTKGYYIAKMSAIQQQREFGALKHIHARHDN